MRKFIITVFLSALTLFASQTITLTKNQIENWQIKSKKIEYTNEIPLGEYLSQIKAPPSMIYSVSLPFSATVEKLEVGEYDLVQKGAILAKVTSKEWIETQNDLIKLNIELSRVKIDYERKSKLCEEGIIPQKQCLFSKAEYETIKNEFKSKKSLLKLYGATDKDIQDILKNAKIKKSLVIKAPTRSIVSKLHVNVGSTTETSNPLLTLISTEKKVLDIYMPLNTSKNLNIGQKVRLSLNSYNFNSRVLKKSKIINPQNQTQRVRFFVPSDLDLLLDYKTNAKIKILKKALKIPKIAAIYISKKYYIFKETEKGFEPIVIEILAEDKEFFYAKPDNRLESNDKIVVEGAMVLKGMMEETND